MTRLPSIRAGLVLGLLLSPAFAALVVPDVAYAQSSPDTGGRRVLKATDVEVQARMSKELEEKAHQARLESIDRLKELIKNLSPETPADQKAEMLLRLSDLYFEEGRTLYLNEMALNLEAQEKCFNTPGCVVENVKPDNVASRTWQDKSIKLYRQILQFYPQFGRADEATFYLGQALSDTGQADAANTELTRLVKVYPDSRYVPDAYILIGEYYFDNKGEAFKALSAYQKAAAYKEHEKWAFAMYKLAWCFYNVGDYGKGIDTMKAVVSYAPADSTQSRSNIQLQDEALKDLVRFFADAGDMDEAVAYFTKLGKKDMIRDLLKRLAATYVEQGKFENAIQMFRRLIAESPENPAAPDFQNEIIAAYTKMGKKEDTLAEIDRLRTTYGKTSGWRRTNAANQDAVAHADEFIEKNLRVTATNYHNEAKKLGTGSQAAKVYGLAEQAYRTYLGEFPEGKYSYDVRYAFSELLYKVKKFDEAYDQYMKVVATDTKGQHSKFCAESAIFAADEMMKREKAGGGGAGPDPGKKTEAIPLSEWEQKSLAALDQYAKLFQDEKVKNIIYKSAYLLYNKNHFKDASERFNTVIKMDPGSREAEQAANLILDSFALVEDWENLKTNSKFYYGQEGLGGSDFKKEVYGIYENASLKLIEVTFKKSQDKTKGAADYWEFYKEFPTSANADLALNNASVYYHEIGRSGDAMKVRLELINKFPKSKFYIDQVASLGFDYESMADFDDAANWYEKLYALKKDHPSAKDAIYSAAVFRNAMGQWEVAIKNYEQFITTFPGEPNIHALRLEIGKIYEAREKWPEAAKVYLPYFADPKKAPVGATIDEMMFARMRYGFLMDKLGQGAKATKHWNDTLVWFNAARAVPGAKFEVAGENAAQILFILAQPQFDAFIAQKIKGPDRKLPQKQENKYLTDQLVAKAKAMQAVEKTFSDIIATGAGEWGLASLTRLGQVYENMGDSLVASAAPSYLTEDQLEIYRMQLEDRAYPNIERATAAYSQALAKAYELSLYNDDTAFATRQLGKLRPDDFPGLFEEVPDKKYTAPSVSTAPFATEP